MSELELQNITKFTQALGYTSAWAFTIRITYQA